VVSEKKVDDWKFTIEKLKKGGDEE